VRSVAKVRQITDEPATNAKYSVEEIIQLLEESYAEVLQELQRSSNTKIVAKYTFTYSSATELYAVPPTVGQIISIGEDDDDTGTKIFYKKGSRLSPYGTKCIIENNWIRFQPGYIADGTTVTVRFQPDGCARLFAANSATVDNTANTITIPDSVTAGYRDRRANSYLGSVVHIMPNTDNTVEQYQVVSAQSDSVLTVEPGWSPALVTSTDNVDFEIIPPFPSAMDLVVATRAALKIILAEGNTIRYGMVGKEYSAQMRSLRMFISQKDYSQGSTRNQDGRTTRRMRGF